MWTVENGLRVNCKALYLAEEPITALDCTLRWQSLFTGRERKSHIILSGNKKTMGIVLLRGNFPAHLLWGLRTGTS